MNPSFLHVLYRDSFVGRLEYDKGVDRLAFFYDEAWVSSSSSFPISLSLPLERPSHADPIVRSFLQGLLPENPETLKAWGKRFQVSPRNPFGLITHVGEDCAGAVQFVRPERLDPILSGDLDSLSPLTEEEMAERIADLQTQAHSIPVQIKGRFSLAGAQTKDALHLKDGQWFVPGGRIPSTHILKPQLADFAEHNINEHFCLQLAAEMGIPSAASEVIQIAGHSLISVKRYDRHRHNDGRVMRIHQEDTCQALGKDPHLKYQTDGGPSAIEIIQLLRDFSDDFEDDLLRFLSALVLNWVIVGTDAHSKNYSLLHAPGSILKLAPLYDLASFLPYQKDPKSTKIKLAMKIGSTYRVHQIGRHQWETLAEETGLPSKEILEIVQQVVGKILTSLEPVTNRIAENQDSPFLHRLADLIRDRTRFCAVLLG